jgi:hypothetical protein
MRHDCGIQSKFTKRARSFAILPIALRPFKRGFEIGRKSTGSQPFGGSQMTQRGKAATKGKTTRNRFHSVSRKKKPLMNANER